MLFNSLEFAFFLPLVFLIYWAIGYAKIGDTLKLRLQNAFVVIASYVFMAGGTGVFSCLSPSPRSAHGVVAY